MSGTLLPIALDYIARGWAPLPIPFKAKRPMLKGWPELLITAEGPHRAELYFDQPRQNIGVKEGPHSGGLTDLDLDCSEAVELAPAFLPHTGAVFGRASRRASHWLYQTTLAGEVKAKTLEFHDPTAGRAKGAMIAEIRIGGGGKGAQTVMPGSTHPSGEEITWDRNGVPAQVDGAELRRATGRLAAAVLLLRHWTEGRRHHLAVALGGVLARCEWEDVEAEIFVTAITDAAGDDEQDDRRRAVEDGLRARRAGQNVGGYPKLKELLGDPVAKAVCAWLGYAERPEAQGNAADRHFDADAADAVQPPGTAKRNWPFCLVEHGVEKLVERVERETGVTTREWQWFCSLLEIAAETRDVDGDEWGRLLLVTDRDGRTKPWAMPMAMLAGDGTAYRERLLALGLTMAPSKFAKEALHEYISTARPGAKARCVGRTGWHARSFVLPDATVDPSR